MGAVDKTDVHVRTGPGLDVAACGERGHKLKFSTSNKGVTCAECKARRAVSMGKQSRINKLRRTLGVEANAANFVARYSKVI